MRFLKKIELCYNARCARYPWCPNASIIWFERLYKHISESDTSKPQVLHLVDLRVKPRLNDYFNKLSR